MKTSTLFILAALAGLATFASSAAAESQRGYTCRSGSVTITSLTPCYATTYGITVPGIDGAKDKGSKNADGPGNGNGGKKGGGFGGPKDLKDKPKGGGFGGPKDLKS
jgi:hypothetical protein